MTGDSGFPPLSFTDSEGRYSGYEAELVVAPENWLGEPIQYRQMIRSEAFEALETGQVHGITGMRIMEERASRYHFAEPYWVTAYSLVYRIGQDPVDLLKQENVSVVVQEDSATYDFFEQPAS